MTYSIRLRRDWELPGKRYAMGVYRVPAEMTEAHAQRAIRSGIAVKDMPVLSFKRRTKPA